MRHRVTEDGTALIVSHSRAAVLRKRML